MAASAPRTAPSSADDEPARDRAPRPRPAARAPQALHEVGHQPPRVAMDRPERQPDPRAVGGPRPLRQEVRLAVARRRRHEDEARRGALAQPPHQPAAVDLVRRRVLSRRAGGGSPRRHSAYLDRVSKRPAQRAAGRHDPLTRSRPVPTRRARHTQARPHHRRRGCPHEPASPGSSHRGDARRAPGRFLLARGGGILRARAAVDHIEEAPR